jgi:hypothetical protein
MERAKQRGRVLTSSMGLWEGPLGVRITQCPYLVLHLLVVRTMLTKAGGGACQCYVCLGVVATLLGRVWREGAE